MKGLNMTYDSSDIFHEVHRQKRAEAWADFKTILKIGFSGAYYVLAFLGVNAFMLVVLLGLLGFFE